MNNVCIIPARGGSKRIPKKNVKLFCGRPMLAHAIELAIETKVFDRILVSTDCEEIEKLAHKLGAETNGARPKELSDDYTGTTEVIKYEIQKIREDLSDHDVICELYPTSALLGAKRLKEAVNNCPIEEFLFAAQKFRQPVERSFFFGRFWEGGDVVSRKIQVEVTRFTRNIP